MKKLISFCWCLVAFCSCLSLCSCADNRAIGEYFLSFEYDNENILGELEYRFLKRENQSVATFYLYPNAYGEEGHGVEVSNLKINGEATNYELCENNCLLKITLPSDVGEKDKVCVSMNFVTKVPYSFLRHGKTQKNVNLSYFYPLFVSDNKKAEELVYTNHGDPFLCEFSSFKVNFTLPSTYAVACGAEVKGIKNMGEKTQYYYELSPALNFACSISENYHIVSKKWGNKRVNYYYYEEEAPEKTLDKIIDCMQFLQNKIGEYPYNTYTVAKSPYAQGGMEYSAFSVVGESGSEEDYLHAIIHETCHQYFPISVQTDEYLSAYLDEGLAEFLTFCYKESKRTGEKSAHAQYSFAIVNAFKRAQLKGNNGYNGIMKRKLSEFSFSNEYINVAYYKGYLLFYHAEKTGADVMGMLKRIYANKKFASVNEDDFIYYAKADRKKIKEYLQKFVFLGGDIPLD